MIVWTLLAIGVSLLCILGLCLGDPKRMRARGLKVQAVPARTRAGLTLIGLLPGTVLVLIGGAPAFLVWLGICAITGWLTAVCCSLPRHRIGRNDQRQ